MYSFINMLKTKLEIYIKYFIAARMKIIGFNLMDDSNGIMYPRNYNLGLGNQLV